MHVLLVTMPAYINPEAISLIRLLLYGSGLKLKT
jgi:hypothetical protein